MEKVKKGKEQYVDACRKKAERDYNKDVQYGKYTGYVKASYCQKTK